MSSPNSGAFFLSNLLVFQTVNWMPIQIRWIWIQSRRRGWPGTSFEQTLKHASCRGSTAKVIAQTCKISLKYFKYWIFPRLMWIAYLEFTHNSEAGDLTWDKVQPKLLRTDKLCNMVRSGIPHSLRPQIWMRLSGALEKKTNSDVSYKEIVRASSNDHLMVSRQIEKDLLRTLPSNACFSIAQGTGIAR